MPFVNIKITRKGETKEQKEKLIRSAAAFAWLYARRQLKKAGTGI
jgi:4-oxalocrotonate tautomerase family enzyme